MIDSVVAEGIRAAGCNGDGNSPPLCVPRSFGGDCDSESSVDEEEVERKAAELPFVLKQQGNAAFKAGNYVEANELWLQSIKHTLKRSVRRPSAALYENQIACRLNLSMSYLKLGHWLEASEQAELVLEQRPYDEKALYRKARALEMMQEWNACETLLETLMKARRDKSAVESGVKANNSSVEMPCECAGAAAEESDADNIGANKQSVGRFVEQSSEADIEAFVAQMKQRIAVARKIYLRREKQVLRRIATRLGEAGISSDRYEEKTMPPTTDSSSKDKSGSDATEAAELLEDSVLKDQITDLVGADLHACVDWRYKSHARNEQQVQTVGAVFPRGEPADDSENPTALRSETVSGAANTTAAATVAPEVATTWSDRVDSVPGSSSPGDRSSSGHSDTMENTESEAERRLRLQRMFTGQATPILPDVASDFEEPSCDDPSSPLWTQAYNTQSLSVDRRPLLLSLPLTFLFVLQRLLQRRRRTSDASENSLPAVGIDDDSSGDTVENGEAAKTLPPRTEGEYKLTYDLVADRSPDARLTKLQRRLVRAIWRRHQLVVHIVGCRGDVDMECLWSAILTRVPNMNRLKLVCIGFLDSDDPWNRSLQEGVLSIPLSKKRGLPEGKKITVHIFKGLYQLFLTKTPEVFEDPLHPLHPDFILVAEPRLARYFKPWIQVFHSALRNEVPLIVTGMSSLDFESHDAANLPYVVRRLGGGWEMPLQRNPYAIKIRPDPAWPPMKIWAPDSKDQFEYSGLSAKNAVVGVIFGRSTSICGEKAMQLDCAELSDAQIGELQESLRPVCDVESEELLAAELRRSVSNDELVDQVGAAQKASDDKRAHHDLVSRSVVASSASSAPYGK